MDERRGRKERMVWSKCPYSENFNPILYHVTPFPGKSSSAGPPMGKSSKSRKILNAESHISPKIGPLNESIEFTPTAALMMADQAESGNGNFQFANMLYVHCVSSTVVHTLRIHSIE